MYLLPNTLTVTPQYNRTRRGNTRPSGTFVIHTAENKTDKAGPDSGDNSVLSWIKQRPDYGSYHTLVDSDSTLLLAPNEAETFHCTQTNKWSIGLSCAVASADWPELYKIPHAGAPSRGHAIIDRLAADAASRMKDLKARYGLEVPVRRLTRAEALNRRPGFIGHGETDPGRRSDPGKAFDWPYFFSRIKVHLGQTTPTPKPPATVPPAPALTLLQKVISTMDATHIIFEHDNGLSIANILAGTWTRVPSPEALEARKTVIKRAGGKVEYWQKFKTKGKDSKADPAAFGIEVKA